MTEPTKELVLRDTELDKFARLGQWLAASESGDQSPNAMGASAALRLFYAHELGLPPLAVAELSVIKGRLVVGAKLLRAQAGRHGYRVRRVDSTAETCTAVLEDAQTGEEIARSTYTLEQAKKAGLVRERSAWTTHPDRMLWARASKYVLDDNAPEVTLGLLTDDEADEITNRPVYTAETATEGEYEEVATVPPGPPDTNFYQPERATPRQIKRIKTLLEEQGATDETEQLVLVEKAIDRDIVAFEELGMSEATRLLASLHEAQSAAGG